MFTVALLASFLVAITISAQGISDATDRAIPVDPEVRIGVLSNGMQYYIRRNVKPENRAELRLAVAAGSVQEDEDQLGVAHFVEHMAFNGSTNFTKNELVDYLESVGTRFGPDLNAYTSFDETVYMLQVRTDDHEQFRKGMLVLHDWAGGIAFEDDEIDKERGVVISEWRTRLSAEQRMQQEYFPKLYYNSRYATRLPIGEPEIIEHASYETVKRFYQDWYRPDLMSLCIVGDFDVDAIERDIIDQFSTLRNPQSPRKKESYAVPGHPETFVSILQDKEATATFLRLMYKHKHDTPTTVGDYRESLLHQLYNRMLNNRLYEVNNTADPPFVFAYSGYGQNVGDLATYTSFARVPETGLERAFETLLTENNRVLRHGFLASELERKKVEMMTYAERAVREADKTESSRYVSACVYHFLQGQPMLSEAQTLELYEELLPTISVEEINVLAQKWIRPDSRVIIITGPDKEGVTMPDEASVLAMMDAVDAADVAPYIDNVSEEPFFDKQLSAVRIIDESSDEALDIHRFTLENGAEVVYKQTDFKNDQILMSAYSWGGNSLYDDQTYFSAQAIGSVMQESGVSSFDGPQLYKKLTGKTVNVSPFIGERFEGFSGSCSPQDFEILFQLVYLYVAQPRLEEQALQAYLKKQISIRENMLSNPNNYFGDVVNKIRYQDHARRGIPRIEQLDHVNLTDMQRVYRDRFADLSDFTFFFTGALDPSQLKELAQEYLGNLPDLDRQETWIDVKVSSPEGQIDSTFHRGEAPRSNVRMIYHGDLNWEEEQLVILDGLIDYARIKLRESLREDMGGVYGVSIYSSAIKEPQPSYSINISFNADPPRTPELVEAVTAVIDEIKDGHISVSDIHKVQELQRQSRIKDLKENGFWHGIMVRNWLDGTPLKDATLEHLDETLLLLTPEKLQAAAQQYFSENRIQVVMYPGS
jgi:zinc protease